MTIREFIRKEKIRMLNPEFVDSNPNWGGPNEHHCHYRVTLKRGRKQFTTYFSVGYLNPNPEPTLKNVLECLISDMSFSDDTFDDFCANLGYSNDSIQALKTYEVVKKQSKRFAKFMEAADFSNIEF